MNEHDGDMMQCATYQSTHVDHCVDHCADHSTHTIVGAYQPEKLDALLHDHPCQLCLPPQSLQPPSPPPATCPCAPRQRHRVVQCNRVGLADPVWHLKGPQSALQQRLQLPSHILW